MAPSIAVIGLGQYFRKLRLGIRRFFDVAVLLDQRAESSLMLNIEDVAVYRQLDLERPDASAVAHCNCIMILTPPVSHLPLLERVAPYGIPVFVEKPLLTNSSHIEHLLRIVEANPHIYCSDFYPDVRALPLRWWLQEDIDPEWLDLFKVKGDDEDLWQTRSRAFGRIRSFEGRLLEGAGSARSFEDREWLWEPGQGGVLRDLMYHYLTLCSHICCTDLHPTQVLLRTWLDGRDVVWVPSLDVAETYAHVTGRSANGVPFVFEVGKYHKEPRNDRSFTIYFERGSASMLFEQRNSLVIRGETNNCEVLLDGNYYEHVAKAFRIFVERGDGQPHGLREAISAVRAVDASFEVSLHANEPPQESEAAVRPRTGRV
jgi:predicted dehydrogenase